MIRCSECDGCKQVSLDYGRKKFYFCGEKLGWASLKSINKFWEEKPKGHPRWCPKYKEAKNVKQNLDL